MKEYNFEGYKMRLQDTGEFVGYCLDCKEEYDSETNPEMEEE